jgi:hypothetical protein
MFSDPKLPAIAELNGDVRHEIRGGEVRAYLNTNRKAFTLV